jgi:hypothetical protein
MRSDQMPATALLRAGMIYGLRKPEPHIFGSTLQMP